MKEIVLEIKDFLKKDFNIYAYSYTIIFLALSLWFNYKYNFEDSYIDRFYTKDWGRVVYFLYYVSPYLLTLIPILIIKKQTEKLLQREFWIKTIIFFGIFAIMVGFHEYRQYAKPFIHGSSESYLLFRVLENLKRIIPFLLVFYIVKRVYDKEDNHLYGLRYRGMSYAPFFTMLFLMMPLIAAASFLPSFQQSYPQYKFWVYKSAFGLNQTQMSATFLTAYALDFVSVELLFRGALIIGMARVLGREAVLPMAAAYVIIHFGKPAGEAISAFFGGFILGVHSLAKRNIFGGIIIHVGIALLMELAAILQHFYGN